MIDDDTLREAVEAAALALLRGGFNDPIRTAVEAAAPILTAAKDRRIAELEAHLARILEWWPEGSEGRYEPKYGDGFARDIRDARAALTGAA